MQKTFISASLKFENEAHLGHIKLKMMPTLGTSRPQSSCCYLAHLGHIWSPQRQVLYSASTSVNSYVGLCFFVAIYRNDLQKFVHFYFFGVP